MRVSGRGAIHRRAAEALPEGGRHFGSGDAGARCSGCHHWHLRGLVPRLQQNPVAPGTDSVWRPRPPVPRKKCLRRLQPSAHDRRPGSDQPGNWQTDASAGALVLTSINTVTFAEGAWVVRSRSKEEAMQGVVDEERQRDHPQPPSARRIATGLPCLRCCASSPMSPHRLVVTSGIQGGCARNKHHRIYGSEHLVKRASSEKRAFGQRAGGAVDLSTTGCLNGIHAGAV